MSAVITKSATQNPLISSIAGTTLWASTKLKYYFLNGDELDKVYDAIPASSSGYTESIDSNPYFKETVLKGFSAFEQVSNLKFEQTKDINEASIKIAGLGDYFTSIGPTAGTADLPGNNPADGAKGEFESYLLLNTTTPTALLPAELGGANSLLSTVLHEIGHVVGFDHPHDTRNETTAITLGSLDGEGDLPLDNRRYTVMSYEDGGLDVYYGRGHGHSAGLGALDIAALHATYGANPTTNKTDTTYRLTDPYTEELDTDGTDGTVQIGRAFLTIWDTGGTDTLLYEGSDHVILNLNEASLTQFDDARTLEWIEAAKSAQHYDNLPEEYQNDIEQPGFHAGGFFSRTFRNTSTFGYDLGGFSISNGVEIENATASQGNDFIIGNEANNFLEGGDGEDFLHGSDGHDSLIGGDGDDELFSGSGNDLIQAGLGEDYIYLGAGQDTVSGDHNEIHSDVLIGFTNEDQIVITDSTITGIRKSTVGDQHKLFIQTEESNVQLSVQGDITGKKFVTETDPNNTKNSLIKLKLYSSLRDNQDRHLIIGTYEDDKLEGTDRRDLLIAGDGNDKLEGQNGNDNLIGAQGDDTILGGDGNDRLVGGRGSDYLEGGSGRDRFVIRSLSQAGDYIADFEVNTDKIFLKRTGFQSFKTLGALSKAQFTIGSKASTSSHHLIYNDVEGELFFDPDGSGGAGQKLIANLSPLLNMSHKDFRIIA